MKEFVKSSFSLGIALSLFALKQTETLFSTDGSQKAIEAVSNTIVEQLGGTLRNTFSALDNVQRGLVEVGFGFFPRGTRRVENAAPDDGRTTHVFRDEATFDSRRATILRTPDGQPLTGRRS